MFTITNWLQQFLAYNTLEKNEFSSELQKKYKIYNNTIIYSEKKRNGEETDIKMDIEIDGRKVKTVEATYKNEIHKKIRKTQKTILPPKNAKGDVVTSEVSPSDITPELQIKIPLRIPRTTQPKKAAEGHFDKNIVSLEQRVKDLERKYDIRSEAPQTSADNDELLDVPLPFRMPEKRSSLTNVNSLYVQCPIPQPPLTYKQLKSLQLNEDHALIMAEQVGRMKSGMEKLHEIVKKFNQTEKFKEDIDFILKNAGSHIAKNEAIRKQQSESSTKNKRQTEL